MCETSKIAALAGRRVEFRHFYPFLGFAVPTVLVSYGLAIPRSCLAGVNPQTVGFGAALVAACLAYWQGIRLALGGMASEGGHPPARPLWRLRHFAPLVIFLTLAAGIGFGFVIPGSCIAGVNEHSIGFGLTLAFAGVAYGQGIRRVLGGAAGEERREEEGGGPLKVRYFFPLLGFLLPTVVMGYGVVIPRSCIAGVNEPSVGFGAALVGACFAYWQGIRLVLRACGPRGKKDDAAS